MTALADTTAVGWISTGRTKPALANFSIGQGDLQVTPLQLLRLSALIANGGVDRPMRLWEKAIEKDGSGKSLCAVGEERRLLSEKTAAQIGAAAAAHEHGNITSGGAIGSTADQAVMTGTGGKLVAVTPANARTKLDVYSKTEVQNYVTTQINAITDYEAVKF